MICLETPRLILRNYTPEDVPAVHAYFSLEEVARYEDFDPMSPEEVAAELSQWKDMDNRMLAVLKTTGEVVGSVGYWVDEEGKYSVDFDFHPRFWHQGYAFEAAREVVRHLEEDKGVAELWGDCDARNHSSARLLRKLGFRFHSANDHGSYKTDAEGKPILITVNVYRRIKHAVRFREATRADVPLILSFIRKLAAYEKMSDQVVADEKLMNYWLFDQKKAEVIFALEGDKEVGMALYFHNFSTFLGRSGIYLEDLFVLPSHRGKGYGKALLVQLASIARERGCGRLEWCCLDWNQPSIDFYLSLGAQPMSEWTIYRVTGEALQKLAGRD